MSGSVEQEVASSCLAINLPSTCHGLSSIFLSDLFDASFCCPVLGLTVLFVGINDVVTSVRTKLLSSSSSDAYIYIYYSFFFCDR